MQFLTLMLQYIIDKIYIILALLIIIKHNLYYIRLKIYNSYITLIKLLTRLYKCGLIHDLLYFESIFLNFFFYK